jgi:mannose-6-phosphate isomerase-like protein (cupin superfamily)
VQPYTVARFEDVPNVASPLAGAEGGYDLRMLRRELQCGTLGVSRLRFAAGWTSAFGHRHALQEEVYVLVSGRALARLGDDVVELEPWTAVRVAPRTWRAFRALGDEDAVFVAVGAPVVEGGDGEMDAHWLNEDDRFLSRSRP